MLVFGIFMIASGLLTLLLLEFGGVVRLWVLLAFSVLIVAAGISVLRRRAYWWALLAAIGMIIVGTTNAVFTWQDLLFERGIYPANPVLWTVGMWGTWGIPGLLALIFLVKRKSEFEVSPEA